MEKRRESTKKKGIRFSELSLANSSLQLIHYVPRRQDPAYLMQPLMSTASCSTSYCTSGKQHTNELIKERSAYLLQHAHNPVDWNPWGAEAITRAVSQNKPIFVSIGYSTCHWCHVMERETFENEEIARLMNHFFVCIKVDREERPDIDKVYMSYVQKTTGSGGWPLSVFLTPALQPLFGGTYFPPEELPGQVGFKRLIEVVHNEWTTRHDELCRQAAEAVLSLQRAIPRRITADTKGPETKMCVQAFQHFLENFDREFGGFTKCPKFPHPSIINFLFNFYYYTVPVLEGIKAVDISLFTLKKMWRGGIQDHLGYGFCRYALDRKWHVPHFEKMLYDQALIAINYLEAYTISKASFFADVAQKLLTFVMRDMHHDAGAFYGAVDADSRPSIGATTLAEGAYYLWRYDDVKNLIKNPKHFEIYAFHMSLKEEGNVDPVYDRHSEFCNKNILAMFVNNEVTCEKFSITEQQLAHILDKCSDTLFNARLRRPKPRVDGKIVTSWNGLMISALARASFILDDASFATFAVETANFVRKNLTTENGDLMRCCYIENGCVVFPPKPIEAFLDDYAFLIQGLINLYEATLDCQWLMWAEQMQVVQHDKFWDEQYGAYFVSAEGDKYMIYRDKEDQDGSEPCGNSIAAWNLIRLSTYLDRPEFIKIAKLIICAYSYRLRAIPFALPEMCNAYLSMANDVTQIYIVGPRDDKRTKELLNVVRKTYVPCRAIIIFDGADGPSSFFYKRHKSGGRMRQRGGVPTVYVCHNHKCFAPITCKAKLEQVLSKESGPM